MRQLIKFVLLLFMFCSVSACGEYELLEQQKKCKKVADSLYRADIDSLRMRFDSVCAAASEQYYKEALDSLRISRIKTIQDLIKK